MQYPLVCGHAMIHRYVKTIQVRCSREGVIAPSIAAILDTPIRKLQLFFGKSSTEGSGFTSDPTIASQTWVEIKKYVYHIYS